MNSSIRTKYMRRAAALRTAIAILAEMAQEKPEQKYANTRMVLDAAAKRQENELALLDKLSRSKRKPPIKDTHARVAFRSPQTAQEVGDYDMEEEAELRDQFGNDLPDGSD